jgi:hypothetical protein
VDAIAGTAKRYYYDDQRIALQTSVSSGGSETDEKYFVYGNYIDEVLLMCNLSEGYQGDFYYGHDHLYSPAVLDINKGSRNRFRPFPASFRPSRRLRPRTRFPFAFGPRWQVSHSKKTAQNI